MPTVHKKTFVFLVSFMKDLIKSSEINGLDPKILGKELFPVEGLLSSLLVMYSNGFQDS